MTEQEFEQAMDRGDLDEQYCDFIMQRQSIGSGDAFLELVDRGTYYESFKESMVKYENS